MHDTNFYYNETIQSVREVQYFEFDTVGHYDNQRLIAVVNLTAVDDELPPEFVVAWGNRSAYITLQDLQESEGNSISANALQNLPLFISQMFFHQLSRASSVVLVRLFKSSV